MLLALALPVPSLATPCKSIDRTLSIEARKAVAVYVSRDLNVQSAEILQLFRFHDWRIYYVDTFKADEAFLFYRGDPSTSRYIALWSGSATIYEKLSIEAWERSNVPGIPETLARCFAWHVTKDRNQ